MSVAPYDPSDHGFRSGSAIYAYPRDAKREINEALMRIRGPQAFLRFWNRVLTDDEREVLGGGVEDCFVRNCHCVNLLCELRSWIPERAIVEIAYQLEFLTVQRYSGLMTIVTGAEIGLTTVPGDIADRPSWDRQTGQLKFQGQLCREFRVARATKIVPVLDSFEEAGWPSCIEHQVSSIDPQRIHDVVGSLNSNLQDLHFRVNGNQICWEPATTR